MVMELSPDVPRYEDILSQRFYLKSKIIESTSEYLQPNPCQYSPEHPEK